LLFLFGSSASGSGVVDAWNKLFGVGVLFVGSDKIWLVTFTKSAASSLYRDFLLQLIGIGDACLVC
jgi:hypothetical protein